MINRKASRKRTKKHKSSMKEDSQRKSSIKQRKQLRMQLQQANYPHLVTITKINLPWTWN